MVMECRVGTSGYSYKAWRGPFYPEKLPAKEMLRFYAGRLPAVEINNTFYRLPKPSVLESWSDQVPEGFRFSIKASRRITHLKRLKRTEDETGYLLRTTESLGERLGAILFQLPPNLPLDLPRLEAFLELLPEKARAAFEFRHPSWAEDKVYRCLRARDCALAIVDGADDPEPALIRTASWGYLRLRRPGYERADLATWMQRIRSQGWDEVFVFFKHEDKGAGPELAARFLEVAERTEERKGAVAARKKSKRRRAG
jgi:uncharacterized protein YecE (DUF72 family)